MESYLKKELDACNLKKTYEGLGNLKHIEYMKVRKPERNGLMYYTNMSEWGGKAGKNSKSY